MFNLSTKEEWRSIRFKVEHLLPRHLFSIFLRLVTRLPFFTLSTRGERCNGFGNAFPPFGKSRRSRREKNRSSRHFRGAWNTLVNFNDPIESTMAYTSNPPLVPRVSPPSTTLHRLFHRHLASSFSLALYSVVYVSHFDSIGL